MPLYTAGRADLCDWVLARPLLRLPPTYLRLKESASHILIAGGDLQPLGKNWIAGFLCITQKSAQLRANLLTVPRSMVCELPRSKIGSYY